jgi:hypothetical protein
MRAPYSFICKPVEGVRYNNTKEVGGIQLIVNTSEENHKFSNRHAEVVSLPLNYVGPIQQGDILLVHHNVFKFYNDMRGRRKSGKSFFKEDIFFVDYDQFYMFQHDGVWTAYDKYCFVSPIGNEAYYIKKLGTEEPLVGIMEYPNEYLMSQGIQRGDKVSFTPESEYEFTVDNQKMYRIFDHQITIKL